MNNFKIGLVISIIFFSFLGFNLSQASQSSILYLDGLTEIGKDQQFSVKVLVSTDQPLNAYSLVLNYFSEFLNFEGHNNAGSIVDVVREAPKVFESGAIKIEGASLEPFLGEQGLLVSLKFKALKLGETEIDFGDSRVYLANGKGTEVTPAHKNFKFKITNKTVDSEPVLQEKDEIPPQIKIASLDEDPISKEQRLFGFLVGDNESGVKETILQTRRWLWWSGETVSQNPTALAKEIWSVKLKVVDNFGNIAEKVIYDWSSFLKYTLPILVIGLILLFWVMNIIFKRKKGYNKS